MPETISFTIPGEPVAWQRRVVTRKGQQFTPAKMREQMARVRWLFDQAAPGWKPHLGPVELFMCIWIPPPKRWPQWRHDAVDSRRWPAVACCKKPDASNVLKLIEDALNGLAYRDDAQIAHIEVDKKWWHEPGVEITLRFWPALSRGRAPR